MILYNVTVNIDPSVEMDWLSWMKSSHIPKVMDTGCFTDQKFFRLLNEAPDATGSTYAIQYFASGEADLTNYLDHHAADLQKEVLDRYPNKFVAFRTYLEEV
ncbi:MAG: DUF4286 family protein [Cyclobacteriaceae bacterium]